MADEPVPEPVSSSPTPTLPNGPGRRRPVYEPSLLPARKHRRASPWLIIPLLLLGLGGALYYLLIAPHQRRFVPTAGKIVFVSDQGTPGHPHLWIADSSGQNAKQLPGNLDRISNPVFSPDGSQIAFLAYAGGNPQVFLVDADGQNPQQITRNIGAKQQPAFAPSDNARLAYASGGVLSTVNTITGDTDRLLPPVPDTTRPQNGDALINSSSVTMNSYSWAPATNADAQALAAVESTSDVQALVILPSLNSPPHDTQTDQPNSPPLAAADTMSLGWSPDGTLLAAAMLGIQGLPAGRQVSTIVLFHQDGSAAALTPLATMADRTQGPQHPVFSPDGTHIAFELWKQPDIAHTKIDGLYLVPVDDSTPPQLLVKGDAENAQFSADGQQILFLRRRPAGGQDLFRVGLNGTGLTRVFDGVAEISGFAVSPGKAPR